MKGPGYRRSHGRRWIRALQVVFWVNVVALTAAAALIFLGRYSWSVRAALIEVRSGLLTSPSSDFRLLDLVPTELDRTGFLSDSPATLAAWRMKLGASIPEVLTPIERASASADEVSIAQTIVLSFSAGGDAGELVYWMEWPQKVRAARRGAGLCSDHTKIFLALAKTVGLNAREVHNGAHSYVDFFSVNQKRWIFIDPQYAIMATDGGGEYLSSRELRYRRLQGQPTRFVFFGTNPNHIHAQEDTRFKAFYGDRGTFERYILTNGNNVATQALTADNFAALPWEARELLLYVSRRRPGYVQFVDEFTTLPDRKPAWGRGLIFAVVGYGVVGLVLYPLVKIADRLQGTGAPAAEESQHHVRIARLRE